MSCPAERLTCIASKFPECCPCSGSLPSVSGEFANLRILNISNNSISGTLPAVLGGAAMFKQVSCAEPGSLSCLLSGAWLILNAGIAHVGSALDHHT